MRGSYIWLIAFAACAVLGASRAFAQDVTAPGVVPGSVIYAVFPSPYSEVAVPLTVTAGGEVRLSIVASEALARAVATFAGPETLSTAGTVAGTAASFTLPVTRALAPGTYSASLRLVDLAGNVAALSVDLPSPGFIVEASVGSPCTLLDAGGAPACSDVDADGRTGRSAACPAALDCDDTNPTIHPRAPEIPGDGVDNDCSGNGDAPVDETVGVFVSRRGNSSSQAGTRRRPFHKITDAVVLAQATGRVVFVSNESYDGITVPATVPVSLFGGFNAQNWTRAPFSRTTIAAATTMTVSGPLFVGVDVRLGSGSDLAVAPAHVTTFVDVGVSGPASSAVRTSGESRFARVEVAGPTLSVDTGTLVVMHAELGNVISGPTTALQLNRTVVVGPLTTTGNLAVIRGFHTAPIIGADAVMRISSTTVRHSGPAAIRSTDGVVTLYNSLLADSTAGLAHTAGTIIRVEHNLFDVACPLAADSACGATPCGVNGNVCGSAGFTGANDFHISASSPAADVGMRLHPEKTPTSSVVDIDGDCRSGELDVGADEAR